MPCLVKDQAKVCQNQDLLFLQHSILLPGHRVAAAGHTAWYLRETQKSPASASSQLWHTSWMLHPILPGKEYKTKILSKLSAATCKQLHFNSKPPATECGTQSRQKSERLHFLFPNANIKMSQKEGNLATF